MHWQRPGGARGDGKLPPRTSGRFLPVGTSTHIDALWTAAVPNSRPTRPPAVCFNLQPPVWPVCVLCCSCAATAALCS